MGAIMQLKKMMPWGRQEYTQTELEPPLLAEEMKETVAAEKSRLENPIDNPVGLGGEIPISPSMYINLKNKVNPTGPMSSLPLNQFFSHNFVNQGRYTGSSQKSQESLEQGLAGLVAQFQNAIFTVMDETQAKIDSLRKTELQTEGITGNYSGQLKLACTRLERDLLTLSEQIGLSDQRKGWVLAALNEYQIGFDRGLREAIDAELLGL